MMLRLEGRRRSLDVTALVFDLDRTLTDRTLEVVPEALTELARARRAGATIVLATGRNRRELERRRSLIRRFDLIIGESGGIAGAPGRLRRMVRANGFVRELAAWLDTQGIEHAAGETSVSIRANDRPRLRDHPSLGRVAIHPNRDRIDLVPAGIDKGATAKRLLRRSRGVVAFADGANDRTLFKFADHAVAVANAVPSLKRLADETTRFYGGHGVADYLRRRLKEEP